MTPDRESATWLVFEPADLPACFGRGALDDRLDLAHRVELERVVDLGCLQERARLLDRPVAAPDQRYRDRLGTETLAVAVELGELRIERA